MQCNELIEKALVIDLDVHQGDGTAKIFENDPTVCTFSMHQQNNFPYSKQRSDLDVGLPDHTGDVEYLSNLTKHFSQILSSHNPDLVVYVAGADTYEHDRLGGLDLTLEGMKKRDEVVFSECMTRRIPVVVTLAGGYAENPSDTALIHLNTLETLVRFAKRGLERKF